MKSDQSSPTRRFSPRATLAAIGVKLRSLKFFQPIEENLKIHQKTVLHTPVEKLQDAFIAMLAGAHGIAEINTRLRSDEALQRAFGRTACAEQSVVQETLNACTPGNIKQMERAIDTIFRTHSLAYRHNYQVNWQLLDIDITGLPCGLTAKKAEKGYFSEQGIRYGRQLGRVIATDYEEIIVDRLYSGTVQLTTALRPLVLAAEQTLELDEAKRKRTILRIDAGGGAVAEVNWCLARDYHIHCKDYSSVRAEALARTVTKWITDPQHPQRQFGWVAVEGVEYVQPVRRLAMRWRKKNGQLGYAVLISTLEPCEIIQLAGQPLDRVHDERAVLLAYAYFYDQRGGAIEIENKEDKQGLGLTKRSKKKFDAQRMVMLLGSLAHNVIVWARRWMSGIEVKLARFGVLRLVRDVLGVSGCVELERTAIKRIILNRAAPQVRGIARALAELLKPQQVVVEVGQT